MKMKDVYMVFCMELIPYSIDRRPKIMNVIIVAMPIL